MFKIPLRRHSLALPLVLAMAGPALAGTPLRVQLPADAAATSGRLLISVQAATDAEKAAKDGKVSMVTVSPWRGATGTLAAMELPHLAPGKPVTVDGDSMAYPAALSTLAAGSYYVQAVLDQARDNGYSSSGDDLRSLPVKVTVSADTTWPLLVLDQKEEPQPADPWALPAGFPTEMAKSLQEGRKLVRDLDFVSPTLSAFWGRPMHVRGAVALPPGYASGKERYPVVYSTHGFGGDLRSQLWSAARMAEQMKSGKYPPMIWVYLDQSTPTGTHEFADSVNNGPWGAALTEELIPHLEGEYRMDAKAPGRFVTGHSSGGWAALWLQVRYPKIFGGSWPTAPDPSDFRDFTNVDIYAANANAYRRADGSDTPLVRNDGKVVASFQQFARLEQVTAPYGGQLASFEWVFSPRGVDGRPMPLFNRMTGAVDPQVAAYWREHYDIAHRIRSQWKTLKPDLDGRLHMLVGTADTFYLDHSARKLAEVLAEVGAKPAIRFVPGRDHGNLLSVDGKRGELMRTLAWEMYAVARPKVVQPKDLPRPELEAAAAK